METMGTIWGFNAMLHVRDPNYWQPILNPGGFCQCILVAAQDCFLIKKKSGYTVEYKNVQDCPKRISPARSVREIIEASRAQLKTCIF